MNPTEDQINKAAVKWCEQKDREIFLDDIVYFRHNWRHLPGLLEYVKREMDKQE